MISVERAPGKTPREGKLGFADCYVALHVSWTLSYTYFQRLGWLYVTGADGACARVA